MTTQTVREDDDTVSINEHSEEKEIAAQAGELRRVDHDHFSLWLDKQNIEENTCARILYVIDAADAFARQNHMPKARLYGITDAWQGSYALNMMVAKRAFVKANPDAARQLNQYGRALNSNVSFKCSISRLYAVNPCILFGIYL